MKKLLIPSLLAGLMICIPTLSAHADDPLLGYEPYSWDEEGIDGLLNESIDGYNTTHTFLGTPSPAGFSTAASIKISGPSGVSGSTSMALGTNSLAIWQWTSAGTPADFSEVRSIQMGLPVSAYSGSGSGTGGGDVFSFIATGRGTVGAPESYDSLSNLYSTTTTPTWDLQEVNSEDKTGDEFLWSVQGISINWYVDITNGGVMQTSTVNQTSVAYVTP